MSRLEQVDPEIAKAIHDETVRQSRNLELIASENFVSEAVLEAVGSVMTNKYAEGYPGKRYYGGCEIVDIAEDLAISRAKELFGAEHVNVQPHSGSQANMAVYFTLLKPGDTVLGPNLAHGGHLTAGSPINFSGRFYKIVPYGVTKDTERIDLDQVRDLAKQHRPKLVIAGGSAFPGPSTSSPFARSRTRWTQRSWPTSPIPPVSWPRAFIPPRCPTPTSSPPPPTRRCAAPGRHGHVPGALREGPRPDRAPGIQGGP